MILVVDGAAALLLAVACVVFGLVVHAGPAYLVVSLLLSFPLLVRRRRPDLCLLAVTAAALLQWPIAGDGNGAVPADVAVPIAVHAAAAYGRAWVSRAALVVALAEAVPAGLYLPLIPSPAWAHVLVGAVFASSGTAAWALGALRHVRIRQAEAQARLAVLAERTRIAREMHDVVAHCLAVVIAQADGGRYAGTPEAGTAALIAIGDHARRALAETRRVLGVLREGGREERVEELPSLVERVRAGGLAVDMRLDLPPEGLEPGLSLAAYRIVQEGLTNVLKHAGTGARSEIAVRCRDGSLDVEVLDDGRGPASSPAGGYGLIGMRERVRAYGGTVTMTPRPGGGTALRASIPVPS